MRTHLSLIVLLGLADGGGDQGDPDAGGTSNDGGTQRPDGGVLLPDGGGTCFQATCAGKLYQCGNCLDDDGDGLVDSDDPDCFGPCHNDEASFDIGIQAAKGGNCDSVDCYFDDNAGRGNDECVYSFRCDPEEPYPSCPYNGTVIEPDGGTAACPGTQNEMCLNTCRVLTPNGCDCFGCCSVTMKDGGVRDIFLGSEDVTGVNCTLDQVDNPNACRACTKNPSCEKACGRCQLCIGKTTLPPDCFTDAGTIIEVDGGTAQCPGGQQPCGLPGQPDCPAGFYCLTGCCVGGDQLTSPTYRPGDTLAQVSPADAGASIRYR